MHRLEQWGWIGVAIVLGSLAIPWFLWGDATVVAGLPVWLWWHVGWMGLASVVFWLFSRRAWGIGIDPDAAGGRPGGQDRPGGTDPARDAPATGGGDGT